MSESSPEREASAEDAAVDDATAEVPEFTNRAARRSKGKASGKPEVFAKGQSPAGRGSVSSPRQYGTRRSG